MLTRLAQRRRHRLDRLRAGYLLLALLAALVAILGTAAVSLHAPGPMSECLGTLADAGVDPTSSVAVVVVAGRSCCYVSTRERVCFPGASDDL